MYSMKKENVADGYIVKTVDESLSFAWVIKQRIEFGYPGEYFSQEVSTGPNEENTWALKLVVNTNPVCSLYLCLRDCLEPEVEVRVTLSMLNDQNSKIHEMEGGFLYKRGGALGFDHFIRDHWKKREFRKTITDGKLTIGCKITREPRTSEDTQISDSNDKLPTERCLSNDFESVMESGMLSDFTFIVGEQEFPVHKIILASRSPVFAAMFLNEMQEKESNNVEIPDITPDIMQKLLRYIYTDRVKNLEDSAEELIAVAEKYQLEGLKFMCMKSIRKSLNKENAIEVLILADLYHADNLKTQTLKFIAANAKEIPSLKGFDSLDSSHPFLLKEILIAVTNMII